MLGAAFRNCWTPTIAVGLGGGASIFMGAKESLCTLSESTPGRMSLLSSFSIGGGFKICSSTCEGMLLCPGKFVTTGGSEDAPTGMVRNEELRDILVDDVRELVIELDTLGSIEKAAGWIASGAGRFWLPSARNPGAGILPPGEGFLD